MRLLEMGLEGELQIAVSRPIIRETLRVLLEKFHWEGYDLLDAGQRMERIARLVEPKEALSVIEHDEPDNRILGCAKAAGSEYIITEDKDLLGLGTFEGTRIMRTSDFLQMGLSQ